MPAPVVRRVLILLPVDPGADPTRSCEVGMELLQRGIDPGHDAPVEIRAVPRTRFPAAAFKVDVDADQFPEGRKAAAQLAAEYADVYRRALLGSVAG